MNILRYAKAIVALVGAVVPAFIAAYSGADWLAIAVALVGAPAAVAATPNRPAPAVKSSVHDGPVVG